MTNKDSSSSKKGSKKKTVPRYRLVVLGDGGVGKSALTIQFFKKTFVEDHDPTIEDCYIQQTEVDGELCILDVLDTAGQEQFSALREQYMRNGDGFLLVYSVADRATMDSLRELYTQVLRVLDTEAAAALIVGNKVDLPASRRQVPTDEGRALAQELGLPFLETSAKPPPYNVERAFHTLVQAVRSMKRSQDTPPKKRSLLRKYCSVQ